MAGPPGRQDGEELGVQLSENLGVQASEATEALFGRCVPRALRLGSCVRVHLRAESPERRLLRLFIFLAIN